MRVAHASAIFLWFCAVTPLLAQVPSAPDVTIRLYDSFGVAHDDIRGAQNVAGVILEAAGVQTSWKECWRDGGVARGDTRVCGDTLRPTEVIVRIVTDRSDQQSWLMSLGYSLVVANSGPATLATVFGNRVAQLAARAQVDRTTLLGRAIAHEVGHLLLGTGDHSREGLMRPHWSDASLREDDKAWGFSPQEGQHIRAELLARGQPGADLFATRAPVPRESFNLDEGSK